MKKQRRTMKHGEVYVIEEKLGDGDWVPVCQCYSTTEAKELLKNLKILDGEGEDEK